MHEFTVTLGLYVGGVCIKRPVLTLLIRSLLVGGCM